MTTKEIIDLILILKEFKQMKQAMTTYRNSLVGRPEFKDMLELAESEIKDMDKLANKVFLRLKEAIKAL